MKISTREIIRDIDKTTIKNYGIPGLILMENAGRAVSSVILSEFPKAKSVGIICGGGNNGGDGFVVARHLINSGKEVTTYLLKKSSDYKGDAKTNLNSLKKITRKVKKLNNNFSNFEKHDVIVDAIFGTGLDRNIEGKFKKTIEFINSRRTPCVSVDIPSGIDSNSSFPLGAAVKAKITVTFIMPKLGISIYPGLVYAGKLFVADISTPKILEKNILYELTTFRKVKKILKLRTKNTHKGSFGHTLIVAGSSGKSGAAWLSAHSAVRSGSGLVTLAVPKSIHQVFEEKTTESMTESIEDSGSGKFSIDSLEQLLKIIKNKSSLVIGPGISTSIKTKEFFLELLKKVKIPVVIDADGLNILSENLSTLKEIKAPVILTPHPGEMGRLLGTNSKEVQENRINLSKSFSKKYKCWLILKGARTILATPEGKVFVNPTGNPGMASGGMGDVLTGILGSLLSQKYSVEESCILGTFLHGLSADIISETKGQIGITATDVAETIPEAIKKVSLQEDEPFFELVR